MIPRPKGARAARLRQRKYEILRQLKIPEDGLPGSLALTHTKCGKPSCHCARGEGHPGWMLGFMEEGTQRVMRIPSDWVDEVRQRVEAGRAFLEAVKEVFVANAHLVALSRRQRTR